MNYTIRLAGLYCYLPYLIIAQRKAKGGPINLDEGGQPVAFMNFYDRVCEGPARRGERIYVIFVGNVVGITSDRSVRLRALYNFPEARCVRATSLLRAYSLWRYWLRLLADQGDKHPDLDDVGVVRLCLDSLPSTEDLEKLVATEFHPNAPPMFAPPQQEVFIDIEDADHESSVDELHPSDVGEDSSMDGASVVEEDDGMNESQDVEDMLFDDM